MMGLIVVVGASLIGYSRYEALNPVTTTSSTTTTIGPSTTSQWFAALTMDVCGKVSVLPVSTNTKTSGIISEGSGLLLIAPGNSSDPGEFTGKLATLAQFVKYYQPKMTLTSTELQLPGKNQKLWKDGDTCDGKPGEVQVEAWTTVSAPSGQLVASPADLKFATGQMITVAFVPKGAFIPPASKATQAELEIDVEESEESTTTTLPGVTSTTVKTSGPTTTVKAGTTTTTKAGSTTTTTAASTTSSSTTTTTAASSTTTSSTP
jgi:hypothetical protein